MSLPVHAAVVGWPIAHSRSPLIHGYWLKSYGIAGSYMKKAVPPAEVAAFFGDLAAQGLAGCNVTIPHKEAALAAAREADATAIAVGAANTLWLRDGQLHAANTDVYGFMTHLTVEAPNWRQNDRPMVILGAGGSARAVIYGLLEAGCDRVVLVNRTRERAEALSAHFGKRVRVEDWNRRHTALAGTGLLVNTTSLGMHGGEPLDIDLSAMPPDSVVADIVYTPLETALLRQARARGLTGVDGLGMLLHQAVPGFEKWFGRRPEVTPELRALVVADL
jgi:shikimate dehydrogenase